MTLHAAQGWTFARVAGMTLPAVTVLLAGLLMALPIAPHFGGYALKPAFALLVLFVWTIERPELLPPMVVLGLGLFLDLVTNAPIGFNGLIFLGLTAGLMTQRYSIAALPERGLWTAFAVFAACAVALTYLVACLYFGRLVSPIPLLIEGFISAAVFPIVRALLRGLDGLIPPTG